MGNTDTLQCLVDCHEHPFVVIDPSFAVIAVNRAFERARGLRRDQVIGQPCFEVCHHRPRPCYEMGEECPMARVQETHEPCACVHAANGNAKDPGQWVQIKAYPIRGDNNIVYLGECVGELCTQVGTGDQKVSIVGKSPAFLQMLDHLKLAAKSKVPVVLLGETGTGKELAAKFIHEHSMHKGKPFVTVDCTVLTESLIESELFGYEPGAFTGSVGRKQGLLELVGGGTLFLDEIGEMSSRMQAKFLRVLDSGEFRRVGGQRMLTTDARIVCATNCNLWDEVRARRFREDLYYRIACMRIHLPNLAERREDIPILARELLDRIGHSMCRSYRLTSKALENLKSRDYPGNIRELRNVLHLAAAHAPRSIIEDTHIEGVLRYRDGRPEGASATAVEDPGAPVPHNSKLTRALHDFEVSQIVERLDQYHGNRRKVASALEISERTLYRKLKQYDLGSSSG
jgi:two-component system response regulator AtoC